MQSTLDHSSCLDFGSLSSLVRSLILGGTVSGKEVGVVGVALATLAEAWATVKSGLMKGCLFELGFLCLFNGVFENVLAFAGVALFASVPKSADAEHVMLAAVALLDLWQKVVVVSAVRILTVFVNEVANAKESEVLDFLFRGHPVLMQNERIKKTFEWSIAVVLAICSQRLPCL